MQSDETEGHAYSLAVSVIEYKNPDAFSELLKISKRRGMKRNDLFKTLKTISNRITVDFSDEDFKALSRLEIA